jgi:uncharacterized protein (DUF111 family)
MSQHGRIPVPAPATLRILEGVPTRDTGIPKELVTPTGAGILRACVDEFGRAPAMTIRKVGHGAGRRRLPDRPNVVRAILGEPILDAAQDLQVLEANVDDMTPELCGHVGELLMAADARDAWWTPIVMKKGRPGHKLSVLCDNSAALALRTLILRETTSLGVRSYGVVRSEVRREVRKVKTEFGPIVVKLAWQDETLVNAAPEYESARSVAQQHNVPLKRVMAAATAAAWNVSGKNITQR